MSLHCFMVPMHVQFWRSGLSMRRSNVQRSTGGSWLPAAQLQREGLPSLAAGCYASRTMNPLLPSSSSRREFLTTLAAGALTVGGLDSLAADAEGSPRFPLIAFSKPFQKFTAEQTAELVAKVGWDGIECPVRAQGQIEPMRVADDLPRFVE